MIVTSLYLFPLSFMSASQAYPLHHIVFCTDSLFITSDAGFNSSVALFGSLFSLFNSLSFLFISLCSYLILLREQNRVYLKFISISWSKTMFYMSHLCVLNGRLVSFFLFTQFCFICPPPSCVIYSC